MAGTIDRRTGLPKRTRHERTVAFTALEAMVIPFLNVIAKLDIRHGERVPATGAFVISPNHYSNIDPVIMAWAVWKLGRAPRFLAKASLFRIPVVGFALRKSGQIPVERGGSGRGNLPMTAANDLVEHQLGVIVYPEGTLTRDPDMWPMRGKTGAVRLALENGVPLIPAAHWGTQAVLPRYSKKLSLFPRKTIEIVFGVPVDLDDLRAQPPSQKVLNEATDRVMAAITALLEDLRHETAPVKRWNPASHHQTEFGRIADTRAGSEARTDPDPTDPDPTDPDPTDPDATDPDPNDPDPNDPDPNDPDPHGDTA